MVDEAEVRLGVESPLRLGIHAQFRKGKLASGLPDVDRGLDLRSPHEIRLLGAGRPIIGHCDVVVRAADLVLGAVAALGEDLVTANVSPLAVASLAVCKALRGVPRPRYLPGVAALAGLGVAVERSG